MTTLTFAQRQLKLADNMTRLHQGVYAQRIADARSAPAPTPRTKTQVDFQACSQPWETLFAEKLGETEDFKAACKFAGCTAAMGEKALRNPHVCTLAEIAHAKACLNLLAKFNASLAETQDLLKHTEISAKGKFAKREEAYQAQGMVRLAEVAVKDARFYRDHVELRAHRSAEAFKNTRWDLPTAVR
jgi:hypothetical protein